NFGSGRSKACAPPRRRIVASGEKRTFLHVSRVERHSRVGHPKEMFESHARDLQGIEFLSVHTSQDSLDCSKNCFLPLTTEHSGPAFTGQVEKGQIGR